MKLGEFAERAGLKSKTLANIESGGQSAVSIEVITRIAEHLPDTAPEELLADGDDEGAPVQVAGTAA